MPKYIVTHGSFVAGKAVTGIGGELEMSAEEKAHLDPDGNKLATPEVYAAMQKKAEAEAVLVKAAEAPKPKAEAKPEPKPALKGGGK